MASQEQEEFSLDDISLRPLELSDVDDFLVWASDDKVTRYLPWETCTTREDGLDYIQKFAIPHPYHRAICLKNRAIGAILVIPGEGDISFRAELGYLLAFKYWGKGIMTRAVKMVAADVFGKWPHLERLESAVHVDNLGSQRVLEKAGFTREGVLRNYMRFKGVAVDMVMFSLLPTDLS